MNFEEYAAKPLLKAAGIAIPDGRYVRTPEDAAEAFDAIGPSVIKAQVPTGKRGKAGGIKIADTADEARDAAQAILGMEIAGHRVEGVLVEGRSDIHREFYAAVMNDSGSKGPLVLFSTEGGMDIEEVAAETPDKLKQTAVDIRTGFDADAARALLDGLDLGEAVDAIADFLVNLYTAYRDNDAELLEVNPLAQVAGGGLVALDCKFVLDDSAIKRHEDLAAKGSPEKLTELEQRGEDAVIKYIELDGDVGVLANGAGLTMTTMDVVRHHGGKPANFCEIGGEAYTKAQTALGMVLDKPGIKSLVVNFCGAFARCEVMMEGLLNAWDELQPEIPVFFSIAGTGDEEAIKMLKDRLGLVPYPDMDAASKAAVDAARDAAKGDGA
ncbi:MAG: acetate--CoA ligase family protein [Alphaproteobacteria bacterium]|nr:acetate--CoA ligase family protein [Alphaproteobacteria bacterium]